MQDEEWQDLGVPPLVRWAKTFPVKVLMTAEPAKLREIEQTLQEGWNQG